MPGLVTCRGTSLETHWSVASDDWVLPSFVHVPISIFSSVLVITALVGLFVSPGCPIDESPPPPLLYSSLIALLVIEVLTAIDETVIAAISYRGTIWDTEKRDAALPKYIYARFVLLFLEFVAFLMTFAPTFDPKITAQLDCNVYQVATSLTRTAALVVLVKIIFVSVRLLLVLDPCGLLTPGLIRHFHFLDTVDDHGEMPESLRPRRFLQFLTRKYYQDSQSSSSQSPSMTSQSQSQSKSKSQSVVRPRSHSETDNSPVTVRVWQRQGSRSRLFQRSVTLNEIRMQSSSSSSAATTGATTQINQFPLQQIQRRLRVWCFCLGVSGNRTRGVALDSIARALYTVFNFQDDGEEGDGVRLTMTDVVAAFKLVNIHERESTKNLGDGELLEDNFRKVTFDAMPAAQKHNYEYKPPRLFLCHNTESYLELDNLIYYMRYAAALYGWPLYIFANPGSGLCQILSKTCCRCHCARPKEEYTRLEGGEACCGCDVAVLNLLTGIEPDDILYRSMGNEIFNSPFAVLLDRKMEAVVIAIRGTLSIRDLLTDMSYTLKYVDIPGVKDAFVHQGLYASAVKIYNRIWGRTRQEVQQSHIEERSRCLKEKQMENLMKKEREDKMLTCIFQQYKDYQLIVTGHSLGAGVASVLALLLRQDFPDLHCYAFSPPGSSFSYPLTKYSREFITSVVLGNDMVPRLNYRAMLYTKQLAKRLLKNCNKPKFDVLFRPKYCSKDDECIFDTTNPPALNKSLSSRSRDEMKRRSTSAQLKDFARTIITKETTSAGLHNAIFPVTRIPLQSFYSDVLSGVQHDIIENVKSPCGNFTPAFPPGKMFHLRADSTSSQCCSCWSGHHHLEMYRVSNEDMCMIRTETGTLEHHLPNNVLKSLEDYKQQVLGDSGCTYRQAEVTRLREKVKRERLDKRQGHEVQGHEVQGHEVQGHEVQSVRAAGGLSNIAGGLGIIAEELSIETTTTEVEIHHHNEEIHPTAAANEETLPSPSSPLSSSYQTVECQSPLLSSKPLHSNYTTNRTRRSSDHPAVVGGHLLESSQEKERGDEGGRR